MTDVNPIGAPAGGDSKHEASARRGRCVCLLPLPVAELAVGAVLRAGGIALVDVVGVARGDNALARALATLTEMPAPTDARRRVGEPGLRLDVASLALADALVGMPHHIVLHDWTAAALPGLLGAWQRDGRRIWLELRDRAALNDVDSALPFAGWLGRGAEASGDGGRESSFIVAQHLARQPKPFWLQGGIGPHSAAGALACGAERVVLDDALLLTRELALPAARRRQIESHSGTSRWRSVFALVTAVDAACHSHLSMAAAQRALAPGSALAQAHGTTMPIVQGPMTRVSDVPAFAAAVAEAGALPMLALATMSGSRVRELLAAASPLLAGRAWGLGLLGYLAPALADEQRVALAEFRPPFAVIAGGRPDQAQRLAALGIPAYIHAPTPALLRLFVEQGQRRFVLEGSECGGHVGPLGSFALWDAAIDVLLASLPPGETVDVLFAGGIHDARSAAAVQAIAAPLVARGGRIGVLMGSAYLFTDEAVATGAIVASFQDEAKRCATTTLIQTLPGHRIRCAPTPFVAKLDAHRQSLRDEGASAAATGQAVEQLLTGRLRLASKGLARNGAELVAVDSTEARNEGVFMMGDVASLRSRTLGCAALHRDVSEGCGALLATLAGTDAQSLRRESPPPPEPVAIIGIGCLLPRAQDPATLWRNLLDRTGAIGEVPRERWDWRLYYDPDPAARDRIVSRWGGFIDPLPFDPLRYGIPPKSLASIAIVQLLALEVTQRALADAGLGDLSGDAALRQRTATIFGAASTGDLELLYKARSALPLIAPANESMLSRLPEWTEESYPGILLNVIAGRVANRFDLGGCNFTVDAACASSLAALDIAVRELQSGRSDLALAGAVEAELSPHAFLAFSKTQALSPRGRADVFDAGGDGIVISEGAVVLVLKRLADAERDGDRVYATIRAVAGASDGKGMGLTAPKPAGQRLAVQRAHGAAGTRVAAMGLYEAHGTGTRVGDQAEIETLVTALTGDGASPGACVVGSAKSLLGHTRAAAGMVGVAKAALALHHRALPAHAGVLAPLPALREADVPVRLLAAPQPWLASAGGPRLAGVSAFGFGGTNFHAVLEEHAEPGVPGAAIRPAELVVVAAPDRAALAVALERLHRFASHDGCSASLAEIAAASLAAARGPERLALVATSVAELASLASTCRDWALGVGALPRSAFSGTGAPSGEIAFLFPGQGAQHVGMGAELALYQPDVAAALAASGLERFILPPAAFDDAGREMQRRTLADTQVAQPAIAALSCGMLDAMLGLGLAPARVAGHSFGEFVALHAAGVLSRDELSRLAQARGRAMADVGADAGAMAMIALPAEDVAKELVAGVVVANRNSPRQSVISGTRASVQAVSARLASAGHTVRTLDVSGAFHSPLMAPARAPFAAFLASEVAFRKPLLPVHGNRDGKPFPETPEAMRARCVEHLEQPVDFVAQVECLWRAGTRCFVELGPGRALTGLVAQTLGTREHDAIATDGGWRPWLAALGQLWARGWPVDVGALFAGVATRDVDLDRLPVLSRPAWRLDGGRVWRDGETPRVGRSPLRDADSPVEQAPGELASADPVAAAYVEYQRTMRQFLDQQEAMLARLLEERAPSATAQPMVAAEDVRSEPAIAPASDEPADEATLPDREVLSARLIELVAERTGYPPDMLKLDQDLEGELGIDSIKRIEIVGRVLKTLPKALAASVQQQFDRLVGARSLQALVDALLRDLAEAPQAAGIVRSTPGTAPDSCPRFVMRATPRPLPPSPHATLAGLVLVTADAGSVAASVVRRLRSLGSAACLVSQDDLTDDGRLSTRVAVLREVHGPVRGVLHLAGLGADPEPGSLAAWRASTALGAKALFALLQQCAAEIADSGWALRVVAATAMGGTWGRAPDTLPAAGIGAAAAGGAHGILQSLEREHPQVIVKTIDLPVEALAVEAVAWLADELRAPGGGSEVGYRDGVRHVFSVEPAPLSPPAGAAAWRPDKGSVVLATGGARGITAGLVRALARPGVRLVLVGRGGADATTIREREATLKALQAAGAEAEFHGLDVADEAAFGGLIDDVYRRFGRIDAVLHGAGVIEDRAFLAKTQASFDRVFDTKADSSFILAQHLRPDGLRWVVLFGSIAGRFGNRGQADYAAGNETMLRMGQQLRQRWPATRVVTINWGPWAGSGMASDGVLALLESQGILPVEPADGQRFLDAELARGAAEDAEIIAGRGPWEVRPDHLLASIFAASLRLVGSSGPDGEHPRP